MNYAPNAVVTLSDGTVLTRGLFVVSEQQSDKPFTHFALMEVGGVLPLAGRDQSRTVIIELTSPQLQWRYLDQTPHAWNVLSRVTDEVGAFARWHEVQRLPHYDPLFNNCEHMVNYVAVGNRTSPQVGRGLLIAGVAILGAIVVVKAQRAA